MLKENPWEMQFIGFIQILLKSINIPFNNYQMFTFFSKMWGGG